MESKYDLCLFLLWDTTHKRNNSDMHAYYLIVQLVYFPVQEMRDRNEACSYVYTSWADKGEGGGGGGLGVASTPTRVLII